MLEIIVFGAFFFGQEPEQMLFMLYTLMFIWGAAMRAASYPPIFAPHILDVVAASDHATPSVTASAAATTTFSHTVASKYCGRTVGEVAATCGISLAAKAYFDTRRVRAVASNMVDKETKRIIRKKVRTTMSYVLGVTVNFIADVEDWWASQNFSKTAFREMAREEVDATAEASAEVAATKEATSEGATAEEAAEL